jgi:small GTP-binding protein
MAADDTDPDLRLGVAFVGDSGVGKTCIIRRWASNAFSISEPPTIAHALESASVQFEGKTCSVTLWDTPGDPT